MCRRAMHRERSEQELEKERVGKRETKEETFGER